MADRDRLLLSDIGVSRDVLPAFVFENLWQTPGERVINSGTILIFL